MITWLFTQVWLWSLAAFALGALITWLLFVRPLQRRLAEFAAEYPDYEYDQQADYEDPDTEREPLGLLQPTHPRDPDEPPIGDWDRPPRAWADPRLQPDEDADNTWFRKWDEDTEQDHPDAAATAVQPRIPDTRADQKGADPKDGADARSGQNGVAPKGGADARDESNLVDPDDGADTRRLSHVDPKGSAENAPEPETPVSSDESRESTPAAASFSGQLEDAERLSGQLRSLFESELKTGDQPETPYVPPVGAEATQVMPAVTDDEDVPPLPQRTPGAGPHPGRDHGWSGPMVKGHSASRQYHTPESPQYEDIVADVWFRSSKDAEIAGFAPWNGSASRN